MNLLLDSPVLLWALHNPKRLRPEAVAAKGKLGLPEDWLAAAEATGFLHLAISAGQAQASARLPWHHSDPFDRRWWRKPRSWVSPSPPAIP